ncbi:hypothetical protein [Erythrobacter sp.]|uniref:hypothetical protein n=1 Tax=Erythrobacter sp. TaxID=1042 RepID=UPI00311E8F57
MARFQLGLDTVEIERQAVENTAHICSSPYPIAKQVNPENLFEQNDKEQITRSATG